MRRSRTTIRVIALIFALAGCGGGGGGEDHEPTPTPTASVTGTAVPTETPLPSPTATPVPAFDEIVLGVATRYGGVLGNGAREYAQFVLRYEAGAWESVPLRLQEPAGVFGVTFASAQIAYAYGTRGEGSGGLLLRSIDAGGTWQNLSDRLPAEPDQIFDAAFVDEHTGYLVGRGYFTQPTVLRTTDGGFSWRAVTIPELTGFPLFGSYALGSRADAVELVRYDAGGLVVVRLNDPAAQPTVLAQAGDTSFAGGNAFSTAGALGWIAEASGASILSSDAPGAPWRRLMTESSVVRFLNAIDVRDDLAGVTGGADGSSGTYEPLLLTTDDGVTWQPATVGLFVDGQIVDVLRLRGDAALAIVNGFDIEPASLVLGSADGGRTWQHEPTPFERDWQIHDLARNTERGGGVTLRGDFGARSRATSGTVCAVDAPLVGR